MIAHMSYVMCDRCGNPGQFGDDAKEARATAKREGYVQMGRGPSGEDLCASCWHTANPPGEKP